MKHLFNLQPDQLEDFNPKNWDRVLGDPQPSQGWPLDYITREGWRGVYTTDTSIHSRAEVLTKGQANYIAGEREWLKAPMEMADEMLNAVPPLMQRGSSFAMGEPWSDCHRTGKPVYLCFRGFDWAQSTCEAQYLTIADFVALLTARPVVANPA